MTKRGARHVIGIDIRESVLEKVRALAHETGVSDRCMFKKEAIDRVDTITSFDAFEHFSKPGKTLEKMSSLIHPNGCAGSCLVLLGIIQEGALILCISLVALNFHRIRINPLAI